MKKSHPDQVRLGAYLDSLDPLFDLFSKRSRGALALELRVGLSDVRDLLTGGRDLDNFLSPIVQRFGPTRFMAQR
jgi:hypothetical protein